MRFQKVYPQTPAGYVDAYLDGMTYSKQVGKRLLAARGKFSPFAKEITEDKAIMAHVFAIAKEQRNGQL